MKQFMIDAMAMMMPYMKSIAYVGGAAAVLAILLGLVHLATNSRRGGLAALLGKLALLIGIFFIACELAGRFLGMEPTLLFSADPFDRQLYYNQWPFWVVGLGVFVTGLIGKRMSHA